MKANSQIRNYILAGLSASIMAGCLIATKLYGRNIIVIISLVIALLIFGQTVGNIVKQFALKDSEEENEHIEIEEKDERNTFIREKAGAKTNYFMLTLNTIITFVLAFMNTEFWIICLFGALIFIQSIISVLTYNYYAKRY